VIPNETVAVALPARSRRRELGSNQFAAWIWALICSQALWLGVVMSFGWYYQADFSNLADATGHSLSWHYLSQAQGGHFDVVSRTIFWLFRHTVGLNYPTTILCRLAGQAVCTWLLAHLLSILVGRRWGVIIVVGLYGLSPFLLAGLLWFTPSAGLIGAEAAVLVALIAHVHYFRTRHVKWALLAACGIFVAALQADVSAVVALLLPVLTIGFLTSGSARSRIAEVGRCWREWVFIGAPMVLFLVYFFFVGSYGKAAHPVRAVDLAKVIGETWSATTIPSMLGGPWTWHNVSTGYIPISGPTWTVRGICILTVLLLITASVRRTGPRALVAWAMPLGIAAVTVVVVALGRFNLLGLRIAHDYEYHFYTAVPAALGICLAFMQPIDVVAVEAAAESRSAKHSPRLRRRQVSTALIASLILAGSVISAVTFTHRWAQNPAANYINHLSAALTKAGPGVNLFDTPLPSNIQPLIEPNHYVSDMTGLLGANAQFDSQSTGPRLVDKSGDIVAAHLLANTAVDTSGPNSFCNYLVRGATVVTRDLTKAVPTNEWFLRLAFFQQHASILYVSMLDKSGREILPRNGTRIILSGALGSIYVPMLSGAPVSIRIRSSDPSTNVCFTSAQVGTPFPGSGR
jgi:hypothetical protein